MKIRVELRDDADDAIPARSFTIQAANLDAAAAMITRAASGGEPQGSDAPAAGGEDVILDRGASSE